MNPFNTAGLVAAVALLVGILGVGLHIKHRLELIPALQAQNTSLNSKLKATTVAFKQSEELRVKEQAQARESITQSQKQCTARVAEAKRSASAVQVITHEIPKYDAHNCPIRELYSPGVLHDALGAR